MKTLLWCLTLASLLGFSVHADERQTGTTPPGAASAEKPLWRVSVKARGSQVVGETFNGTEASAFRVLQDGVETQIGWNGYPQPHPDASTDELRVTTLYWFKVQQKKDKFLVEGKVQLETSTMKDNKTLRTLSTRSRSLDGVALGEKVTLDLGKDENSGWQHRFEIEVNKLN